MRPHPTIRRALLSVYDKTGIVEFAWALHDEFGIEIISTGGTAKALTEAGIPVTLVETLTGCGEMLDGRVKTLHPAIHAAILADRDNPDHMRQLDAAGIKPIDMVVVNLYPFEKTVTEPDCTFEQAIEMIDIGGVALLRAAAKNHRYVWVIASTDGYRHAIGMLRTDQSPDIERLEDQARTAFEITSGYDGAISEWLWKRVPDVRPPLSHVTLYHGHELRYGENPHQSGDEMCPSTASAQLNLTHGDPAMDVFLDNAQPLSYNNYLDADSAVALCAELSRSALQPAPRAPGRPAAACVFIKHTNACGAAAAVDRADAYRKAYLADPNAAMGGILAVNFPVDASFAALVLETYDRFGKPLKDASASHAPGGFFLEVWVAPTFTYDAVELIRGKYLTAVDLSEPQITSPPKKKWGETVRLLAVGDMSIPPDPNELQYRSIAGGMLVQTPDLLGLNEEDWKVVSQRAPTDAELADLRLAWLICKHTKSNAISIVKDGMLIGNGAGQMSRVMSCRIATWLARENGHADQLPGSAAASDAFFPFPDGPAILIDAGVTALIQPGGSKRDEETLKLCNERGVVMIFTGTRHFRH